MRREQEQEEEEGAEGSGGRFQCRENDSVPCVTYTALDVMGRGGERAALFSQSEVICLEV